MKKILTPDRPSWATLCQRPSIETDFLQSTVRNILNRVRQSGDQALIELADRLDHVTLSSIVVANDEIKGSVNAISPGLIAAIQTAAANIRSFHASQLREFAPVETMPGVTCWRKAFPVDRVGIYIPGGSAPLFSTVLMLAIPAAIAGCSQVVLCTPPGKDGKISPAILYAASVSGVSAIYKAGGAQAIAAMAYGTETIPRVSKIFGPGNQYVVAAKQMVNQEGIAIDLPAGPSEVLVVADSESNPAYVAADLLSQAEHGADSQVVLVTMDEKFIERVEKHLQEQLEQLPRKDIATQALRNSLALRFSDERDLVDFVNEYAPEHLILNCRDANTLATKIKNAGSVFLGAWSPESAGDYASGTNHTLPTNGFARAYSGVSVESFQKMITYQELTPAGLKNLGPAVMEMADAELLAGHKEAINIRLKDLIK
jgi:histidinol dehydrogenase